MTANTAQCGGSPHGQATGPSREKSTNEAMRPEVIHSTHPNRSKMTATRNAPEANQKMSARAVPAGRNTAAAASAHKLVSKGHAGKVRPASVRFRRRVVQVARRQEAQLNIGISSLAGPGRAESPARGRFGPVHRSCAACR